MGQQELVDWIRLIGTENVGPVTFRHLVQRYGSASEALKMLPSISKEKRLTIPSINFAEDQLQKAHEHGIKILTWDDAEYPTYLKAIDSAPPVLYIKGNHKLFYNQNFAIVGSRNASLNGIKFTRDVSSDLGASGLNIVSGLAQGIDTAAHQGSLDTGTIAVLGGGIDVVYPKENAGLHTLIGEQGLLVSEFPFGTPPAAHHFPRRNRIIAGLSSGVLVVEALHQSGSMITANYANDFGRDIFAVPGFPYDPRSEGPNQLIMNGAYLVRSAADIIDHLSIHLDLIKSFDPKKYFPTPGPEVRGLSEMKSKVLDLLSTAPIDIDSIIQHTGLSAAYVWDVMLELELSGKLERLAGNKVSLKS
ncbi:MAG: DNA-protecting protein DprA [Alphaproteobacteria bacterium]|nr:DNA-protecting protein DprA [Alphaproteobacteria bacterium]